MHYSPHQLAYFAHKLTLRAATDSMDGIAGALLDAQVDLNPHQIDAALFATSNPLSKGVILADEVGLGKTIEAGLLIAQRWAERKRHILVIVPANLRKQWHQELADKFGLSATILEAKSFRQSIKDGVANPFDAASSMGGLSNMYFRGGQRLIFYREKLKEIDGVLVAGEPLTTVWDDVLSNNLHKEGGVEFPKSKKPEALIKRCLDLCTGPGDWVLDSFSGSGTTGAVAHKMGRRWIMVELGEHCHTHIVPRLTRVIDGDDMGGITEAVGWQGGGGFRYHRLASSLLQQDRWGQWIVNKDYNAEMLAAAICKLEGFTYAPSSDLYWQHGHSTESDFIYVTTQSLNAEQLQALSEEVGSARTLLVCCGAFRGSAEAAANRYPNLTVKKIPKMVLQKCEWGHDDYSLNVENLPQAPKPAKPIAPQGSLFDGREG